MGQPYLWISPWEFDLETKKDPKQKSNFGKSRAYSVNLSLVPSKPHIIQAYIDPHINITDEHYRQACEDYLKKDINTIVLRGQGIKRLHGYPIYELSLATYDARLLALDPVACNTEVLNFSTYAKNHNAINQVAQNMLKQRHETCYYHR